MSHHLDLEPLLIDRLQSAVPGVLDVLGAADLADVQEASQRFPSLQVYYMGERFNDSAFHGACLEVEQTWAVVVALKHLRGAHAQRDLAGELITAVIAALQGWEPPGEAHGRLTRQVGPPPLYRPGGYAYFPLYFSSRVLTRGAI